MFSLLFIHSVSVANTYYSHIPTISAETFLKMLTKGDVSYFLNIPGLKPNEFFWQDIDGFFKTLPPVSDDDFIKSGFLALFPSITTLLAHYIYNFFKAYTVVKVSNEKKKEILNENTKKCFKTLESSTFQPFDEDKEIKMHPPSHWDIDNDIESFYPKEDSKIDTFLAADNFSTSFNLGDSFSHAAVIGDAFSSEERTSLLVNTRWF